MSNCNGRYAANGEYIEDCNIYEDFNTLVYPKRLRKKYINLLSQDSQPNNDGVITFNQSSTDVSTLHTQQQNTYDLRQSTQQVAYFNTILTTKQLGTVLTKKTVQKGTGPGTISSSLSTLPQNPSQTVYSSSGSQQQSSLQSALTTQQANTLSVNESFCNNYCTFMEYNGSHKNNKTNCTNNCIKNNCSTYCPDGLGNDTPLANCNIGNVNTCIDR